jgi:uncharacterized protein YbaR (Trm112 family)
MAADSPIDPSGAKHPSGIDSSLLDLLACPACLGELRLEESKLICVGCSRGYLILDGIPALIDGRENSQR